MRWFFFGIWQTLHFPALLLTVRFLFSFLFLFFSLTLFQFFFPFLIFFSYILHCINYNHCGYCNRTYHIQYVCTNTLSCFRQRNPALLNNALPILSLCHAMSDPWGGIAPWFSRWRRALITHFAMYVCVLYYISLIFSFQCFSLTPYLPNWWLAARWWSNLNGGHAPVPCVACDRLAQSVSPCPLIPLNTSTPAAPSGVCRADDTCFLPFLSWFFYVFTFRLGLGLRGSERSPRP